MRAGSRRVVALLAGAALAPGLALTAAGPGVAAPTGSDRPVPVPKDLAALGSEGPGSLAPALRDATGTVSVSVAMSRQPVAVTVPEGATRTGGLPSRATQRQQTAGVESQQDDVVARAGRLGARELGRASVAANVVAMTVPARQLDALAAIPGVVSVRPLGRYETHADAGGSGSLAQAADYVQATSVRTAGNDGSGVKVAVLDSGVDFTHRNLGGPGTAAAYDACYSGDSGTAHDAAPVGACAALFGPAAPKVKGGYDFVGERWPAGGLAPDPNPIDLEGHGTHVADIAAGRSADGTHQGIAPGADVYAVKVCSAVATSCSGVAILQGLDWVLDPDGNGDVSDAMDVVNLSLGSSYGQDQDDSSAALDNVARAGVVAVASAGNSADRPFIVGSPSTAPRAISVAQTALPDDRLYTVAVDSPTIPGLPGNAVRNAKLQAWSPAPTAAVTGPLAQPSGSLLGCTAAAFAGFPSGAVALVQRGTCAASLKAQNAQAAGASAVVVWNNVPGAPPDFSFGGGAPVTVPTLTISRDSGSALSAAVAAGPVTVTIDPAASTSLADTVVGTSSRGLAIGGQRAKPDIAAPGAWLSAEVGTGDGQTNFGGTSGAAPVVTGAAALVLGRHPKDAPAMVKARLLNGASAGTRTPDAAGLLYPSPVSRVGAGEVRVAPAVDAAAALTNSQVGGGNVGLGMPKLTATTRYAVRLMLRNSSPSPRTYTLSAGFRDPADAATGAGRIDVPAPVRVQGRATRNVTVTVTVDPSRLAAWPFTHTAGSTGDGAALNAPELDGWLRATSGAETLRLGWTVLPQRSADVSAPAAVEVTSGVGTLELRNRSAVADGVVNVFGLTGTSPAQPEPEPGAPGSPGSNAVVVDLLATGVRDDVAAGVIEFAVAGRDRHTSPLYPAGYEVDVDTDRDGVADYAVLQQELGGFAATGQSAVYVVDLRTRRSTPYFYTDTNFDVSTQVFPVPLSALGLSAGSTFDFTVLAHDNYFTGRVTDSIDGQSWTVGSRRYAVEGAGAADPSLVVPAGGRLTATVRQPGGAGPSSETGLLLLHDDASQRDASAVSVTSP
jgi:subtilisin family serine protease